MDRRIKVLIVDDSAIVRRILTETLSAEADIEVVGAAPDPYAARDMILSLNPDVLTLDIEMPRLDGLSFLRTLMRHRPLPVIMISSLAEGSARVVMQALEAGAVEVLAKPSGPYSVGDLRFSLAQKVRAAAQARVRVGSPAPAKTAAPAPVRPAHGSGPSYPIIAIGASTGGTEAIRAVLERIPAHCPPILVVQHIPPYFSRAFADRLNGCCPMYVKEAVDGDRLAPGLALVAPGDFHMVLRRDGIHLAVQIKTGPAVCYQRPSVDVMFQSVAAAIGRSAVGVLLTGMGSDGAQGLLQMRKAGALTFAQDEASCVVYGMPREAARLDAVDKVLPLDRMAPAIISAFEVPAGARS